MSKVQMLRSLVTQRLTVAAEEIFGLFERTISEYEEELSRAKEENERQRKLLELRVEPEINRADVLSSIVFKVIENKDEVSPERQEWSSTSEDDEEKPQSLQLHRSQTEHMETEADGEDCGGLDPELDTVHESGDLSELQIDFSDVLKETREPLSGEKPFSCTVCKKCFPWRRHLQRHMRVHTGEQRLSCTVCDKTFNWPYQLRLHQCVGESSQVHDDQTQSHRDPDGEMRRLPKKQFPCSDCGKVFGYKDSLLRHIRCHTGEKPFSCSVCGRQFRERGNLGQHMVIHTGEKPFSCSVCDQRFSWRKQLKKHKCDGEISRK
uniref:gastrula zinc finger protein XlCGF42.1-like n=1 Tax=Epinephelus lanceolatus TaxID=310571 RepID=UPI00144550D6|nr:gastrula zinc finger protein XlCGF42.1-like [Epinephelus lanceolatus]